MGNYQEYLKMMPSPLREIDPDQPKRLHTFGNPFKQDKKVKKNKKTCPGEHVLQLQLQVFSVCHPFVCFLRQGMMIDEADEFVAGPQNKRRGNSGDSSPGVSVKRRRSMSPLLRRPQTQPGNNNNNNYVGVGKNPAGLHGQQNLLRPIPQHKG